MSERAAASYLGLTLEDFEKGVRHRDLPELRRTPGGSRWARSDLDAWFAIAGPAATDEHEALAASIDAAWGRTQ